MKKILIAFGTRPEAIKMAPIIKQIEKSPDMQWSVCVTAQHREMLDQVLNIFKIVPKYDLNIMIDKQSLFDITKNSLIGFQGVLEMEKPDMVLVQGDTTTTFTASLAAFYLKISIGHVEAGLRTFDKYHPFPEEKNRRITTALADYHFAPTQWARDNLLKEGVDDNKIWVTGNTSIDALLMVLENQKSVERQKELDDYFKRQWDLDVNEKKLILVTGHRRESFGEELKNVCLALKEICLRNPDISIVYPVHLNPNVRRSVFEILCNNERNAGGHGNIYLIDPLDYNSFVYLMNKSYLILTDSGGIQEEAPSLGKPVLVLRNKTERPEGVESGNAKLVGTNFDKIVDEVQNLIDNEEEYCKMSSRQNPYGDGKAAERIVQIIENY
jgi:UDP-N-acetylglucosamine 2-epimerase (non-hydrolysing)